jgi:uncharacterized protein (TIGR02246 family)
MSRTTCAITIILAAFVTPVWAGPKEDILAATAKWADAIATNDPDAVSALYADDTWGTLSPTLRSDHGAIRAYFVSAFAALPRLKVTFGGVHDNTAVNTGYYTFAYVKDGEAKTLPARYSFTYVKDGTNWRIEDHHSSAVPPAPPR